MDSVVPTCFGAPVFAAWPGGHDVVRSTLLSYQMGIPLLTSQALESYTCLYILCALHCVWYTFTKLFLWFGWVVSTPALPHGGLAAQKEPCN